MESQELLYVILGIVVVSYLFGEILDYINLRNQRPDIPKTMEGYYNKEKYHLAQAYHRERASFSFVSSAVTFLISFFMLYFGGFGWLDAVLREQHVDGLPLALAFFGILFIASDLLSLPFQLYSTFVIEEKYGFNQTTVKTFVTDKLKGYVLGGIIGGGLLAVLILLIQTIGPDFWMVFALIAAAFILFMNMFYATLILPLFNKLTPLEDGELKAAIQGFAQKVGFPLDNIFVVDGSKRSKKANAFFSGIGAKKKIVLYDTLIANHTQEELVAVLAHEVGHFKRKHIIWGYLLSVIQIVFTLWVLSLMVYSTDLTQALGGTVHSIHINLIAFTILFSPISGITGLLMNMLSRKNEFEADAYALETYDGAALAKALKRLSVDTLSELYPHPLYVFFHYSHPPLLQRLEALEKN